MPPVWTHLKCRNNLVADETQRDPVTLTYGRVRYVPEVSIFQAPPDAGLWDTSGGEYHSERPPPFWAFAWPGGQALGRHVLDHPPSVAGRRVLDFAAGGGIAAIACALAGAADVEAAEIDPLARTAIALNAAKNGVRVSVLGDVVGSSCRWDVILCGDVCYEAPMTAHILPWLSRMAEQAEVWIADPGRAYLPHDRLAAFATYRVPTCLELEDRTERQVTLYRLLG